MNSFDKGVKNLREGNYREALKIFTVLIAENPENGDYWSERGVTYFHLNEKKNSISDMNKAVDLQPNKPYRYSSRAYILGHYKMTNEAIADYEKAIQLDPDDAVAQNNLGMLQEQMGYKKEAKKSFEKADNLVGIKANTDLGIQGEEIESRNIQQEINEAKKNQSIWSELKTLRTEEGRKSFTNFIKKGFKN